MNLGFQDRFVPFVEDGSKTHTIRAGSRWKAGMRADLYAKPRQRKTFRNVRIDGSADCICLGDHLMGMECQAETHSRYEIQQIAGRRLLFRAIVIRVESIEVVRIRVVAWDKTLIAGMRIGDVRLSPREMEQFAYRDGFRRRERPNDFPCLSEMSDFWTASHGPSPGVFTGQLIHWDYENGFTDIADTCYYKSLWLAECHKEGKC